MLTLQWVNDIVQEYVYQFQGFCQYRAQSSFRSAEEIKILEANRQIWDMSVVLKTLKDLVKAGQLAIVETEEDKMSYVLVYFGCFASVELARLECLTGDHSSSLTALSPQTLGKRYDLIVQIPICHLSVFYHAGVCYLMIRRHVDAIECFSSVALHMQGVIKLNAGNPRQGSTSQLLKIYDKVLALLAITIVLCPGYRIDDQIRELIENKLSDKFRRLMNGDTNLLAEMFEQACPKFICPGVPDYSKLGNPNQEAFQMQITTFVNEARQVMAALKIRSFLRMYAAIDISKLARISENSETEFMSQILSYKHKTMQLQNNLSAGVDVPELSSKRLSTSDISFYLQETSVVIETKTSTKASKANAIERFFVAGIRKHCEIMSDLDSAFRKLNL
jgi:translation initiation factor 3 subunit L